jgi:hypothetical protein
MQENMSPLRIKSWKLFFSGNHIKNTLIKINHVEKNIVKLSKITTTPTLSRLQDTAFWDDLIHSGADKSAVEECLTLWKKIKPFAHLNAKELLNLLSEEIIPLQKLYEQTLLAIQNERLYVEANHFWPAHWFQFDYDVAIQQLQQNNQRLTKIKAAVQEALLLRCDAHNFLKVPRNVDDILRVLCTKLNALKSLKQPFEIDDEYSATLNDDRRLAIYDFLENSVVDKDNINKIVLASIPKRNHKAVSTDKAIKNELNALRKFQEQITSELEKQGKEEDYITKSIKRFTPSIIKKTWSNSLRAFKDTITDIGIFSILLKLWTLRYFLYLTLSFIAYHYLVQTLMPLVSLLVGTATASIISSVLFYTLALGPAWYLGYLCLQSTVKGLYDYFTHWKRNEIESSLNTLVSTQEFIANHLCQSIIDIPHFDIEHLEKRINHQLSQLQQAKTALNRSTWWERLLCRGYIEKTKGSVFEKLEAQEKRMTAQLNILSTHIATRIGQDIQLVERAIFKQNLVPILPNAQLEKLKSFVRKYGTTNALSTFLKNANIIDRWVDKFERSSMPKAHEALSLHQPWGGHEIREDYLRGWDTIIQAFSMNKSQSDAASRIQLLLRGRYHPSPKELDLLIREANVGAKYKIFLQKLQTQLFSTLSSSNPQSAALLSDNHKALIANWYKLHRKEIKEAEKLLNDIFAIKNDSKLTARMNDYDDEALSKIYELLDGADIYAYSINQTDDLNKRRNLVRKYFENYQGESSRAIRFLRFVPDSEQECILIQIAQKRITWLLKNLNSMVDPSKPFDQLDTELFQDRQLHQLHEKFNFSDFLMQTKEFNQPWDKKMEQFFEACRKNGFDSGKVLKQYQENNKRIKPFMLHQHENAKKLKTCHAAVSNLPERMKSRKLIRECH